MIDQLWRWVTQPAFLGFLVAGMYPAYGNSSPSGPDLPHPVGNTADQSMVADSPSGADWPLVGANVGQTHFSPLKGIDQANVSKLGLAWFLDIDSAMGLAVEPIEVDGTIYLSGSLDQVYAIDARTGELRWHFDPRLALTNLNTSYYARTSKGVAVWDGKVYMGLADCRLIALDAKTGQQLWETLICSDRDKEYTGINGAPRIGGGRVYIGYGGDSGARGSVVALDASTGKVIWRAWTVPGSPDGGFENEAIRTAAKTWRGKDAWQEGGGGVWEPITYDPQTNLLIYGTQGETPTAERGDRLYQNCIVAVHADTGEFAWYVPTYKYMPPGYQGPENFHILITDLDIGGQRRHVAMTVPRFGGFFVLDAKTGQLISEKSLAERGSDQLSPPTAGGEPRSRTNHNWWPMSFSPQTGLVYVPAYDDVENRHPGNEVSARGRLIAWDPIKQSARWSVSQRYLASSGVLSTGGNLVFQGQGTGEFSAYAADDGQKRWSLNTGSAIESVPITYTAGGEQYVLLPVGFGSASRLFNANSAMASPSAMRGPSRLYAFKIGAKKAFPYPTVTVPRVPKPPVQTASAEVIGRGEDTVWKFACWSCHGGPSLDGSHAWILAGAVPDLRYMPADVHEEFLGIVLAGSHRQNGMPGFADGHPNPGYPNTPSMTVEEANEIHAYIIDLEWQAYNAEQRKP